MDQVSVTFEDLETNDPHLSTADKVTVEQVRNIATASFRQPLVHHLVHTGVHHVEEAGSTRIADKILFCKPPTVYSNIVRDTAIAGVLLAGQDGGHNLTVGGSSQVVGPETTMAQSVVLQLLH